MRFRHRFGGLRQVVFVALVGCGWRRRVHRINSLRVQSGFGRSGDFGVNRFGFNGLRRRRGEGPVPAKLTELVKDGLAVRVTGLALGSFGAARPGAVVPGGFEMFVSESDKGHDSGSVGIVAGEATKPRDVGGLCR